MAVIKPAFKLTYNQTDITRDIVPNLKSLIYIDRTDAESDELEIKLDDKSGKWSNDWYPEQGAKLVLELGYEGDRIPAGEFEIDQVEMSWTSSGREFTIKALSAITTKALRTKRDHAYENISLKVLAETVASRSRLTVTGIIDNIKIERETQYMETDLGFLSRVAGEYGYTFNVKNGKIVFTKTTSLLARVSVGVVRPADVNQLILYDTTGRTFRVASHRHFDPRKGRSIKYKTPGQQNVAGDDEDVEEGYVENKQQAELRAQARILKITDSQIRANLTLRTGMTKMLAGNNILLEGFGKRDGKYTIASSSHTATPDGGYMTDVEIYSLDL